MQATIQTVQSNPLGLHRNNRINPVFCVIKHAYQNREIADKACDGIFTNAGLSFEVGVETNWLTTALPEDEEWRIEWYKFYFGLDLAHAFCETGNKKYSHAWEILVRSWITQKPVGYDTSDVVARRIQNWIYAWNAFAAGPHRVSFSYGFEDELAVSLALQVDHLRHNLTAERNHRTLELYALFIAALSLPGLNEDNTLLAFAMEELHQNLLKDVRADGVHREQSTHYHMTALRSFLGARENARRSGLCFPDSYDKRLEKACEFALHIHRPDGHIPALSDSDTGSYLDLLRLAADLFNRRDLLYAASCGSKGSPPRIVNGTFPEGGYFIQRSGWGQSEKDFRDERYLIFDCGPLGDGGHGHYDLLNVEIAANGRALIVDPGRFTYADNDWRHRFKGTAAHNTVCVDDLDQTPYHRGKPKGPVAQGRLLERLAAPGFNMLCGEARSPGYDAVHTRRIFFIAGEYWLIVDSLRGSIPHKFDLRFHLTLDAWNHCASFKSADNTVVRTPEMALIFEPHPEPIVEMGWVSPLYGVKEQSPVVSVALTERTQADFFTLVTPLKLNSTLPRFRVISSTSDSLRGALVEVSGIGSKRREIDQVAWGPESETLSFQQLSCNPSIAWRRTTGDGEIIVYCGGNLGGVLPRLDVAPSKSSRTEAPPARWVRWDRQHELRVDEGNDQ